MVKARLWRKGQEQGKLEILDLAYAPEKLPLAGCNTRLRDSGESRPAERARNEAATNSK
jgi:hypothetical protein